MTTTFTLYWVREDKQGDFNMGSFASRAEAEAAIPAAKAELIDQQPGPAGSIENLKGVAEIEAGSWVIS